MGNKKTKQIKNELRNEKKIEKEIELTNKKQNN